MADELHHAKRVEDACIDAYRAQREHTSKSQALSPQQVDRIVAAAIEQAANPAPLRSIARLWPVLAAAALVSLLIGVYAVVRWIERDGIEEYVLNSAGALQVAHATVHARERSVLRWHPEASILDLERGRIDVAVDPSQRRKFSVRTPTFSVEVTGTRFAVSAAGVAVQEGHVRIRDASGRVLLERLPEGGTWRPGGAVELSAPTASSGPEAGEGGARAGDVDSQAAGPVSSSAEPARAATFNDAEPWLVRARAALQQKDAATVRKNVAHVLGAHPSAAQAAEAKSLLADAAWVEGKPREAAELYGRASADERETRREVALFSRARSFAEAGQRDQAKQAFQQYLAQYPNGRFRREAQLRLRELGAP